MAEVSIIEWHRLTDWLASVGAPTDPRHAADWVAGLRNKAARYDLITDAITAERKARRRAQRERTKLYRLLPLDSL
jgi:hypothetical protein